MSESLDLCPVSLRCGIHERAAYLLETGNLSALREDLPLYASFLRWKWRACTCALYARIVQATSAP
jgi:hypothetical protein